MYVLSCPLPCPDKNTRYTVSFNNFTKKFQWRFMKEIPNGKLPQQCEAEKVEKQGIDSWAPQTFTNSGSAVFEGNPIQS
jgi:hypothetical protein